MMTRDLPRPYAPARYLVALCLAWGSVTAPNLWAATTYSYPDDQGNMVYTDNPDSIPKTYRSRVKIQQSPEPVTSSWSAVQSIRRTVQERGKTLRTKLSSFGLEGRMSSESRILAYALGIGVVLIGVMFLSKSQLVRLLALCLLIALGIGTPVLMYVSDGGAIGGMKSNATAAGNAPRDRLQPSGR